MDLDQADFYADSTAFNLNGTVLRITTRYDNRYAYDVEVERVTSDSLSRAGSSRLGTENPSSYILKNGYAVNIVFELSRMLNFSYELISTVGAYEFANASSKQIDLFASSYVLHEARAKLVDPTFVTGKSRISAFLNRELESAMHDILTSPFQQTLWLSLIGLICLIIGFAAVCIAKVESKLHLYDVQFQLLSVILLQGTFFRYERFWNQMVVWIMSISFLIVSAHFAATLVSTKAVIISGIKSLHQLADSEYAIFIEYGYNNGSSIQDIAEGVRGSTALTKALLKASQTNLVFENFQQMMTIAQGRPVAYVIDDETGFSAIEEAFGRFPCSFNSISFDGLRYQWSMFMRKNMPHKKAINMGLLKLDQAGILSVQRRRWVPHVPEECTSSNDVFSSVELNQLHLAFIALSVGVLASVCLMILERLHARRLSVPAIGN